MREDKDKITRLYDTFVADGYDMESEDDFRKNMSDAKKRKAAYDALVNDGYEMEPFDEFENNIGYGSPKHSFESAPVPASSRPERPQGWNPTGQEKRAMQHDLSQMAQRSKQMTQRSKQMTDAFHERMNNMREYGMGLGMEVKEGKKVYNPESGKFEQTYLTPVGNRYSSKALADAEQRQIKDAMERFRQAADMSVSGQLRRARQKLTELQAQRSKRADEVHDKAMEFNNTKLTGLGRLLVGGDIYRAKQQSDPEKNALNVAIRQTEELIKDLEEQQAREQGEDVGFWRGFGRKVGDFRTWDFGISDSMDAMAMANADQLKRENATEGERAAYDEMMVAIHNRDQAEQAYGGNASFWNRAGIMAGYMPSFMIDFLATGGGFDGINVLSKAGAKGAVKVVGKEVAEEMAKQGVKAYVKNNGVKGLGQVATHWTIKALGTTADDLLLRAPLMTNTIQAGKTVADIIDRKLGDVVVDENGNYDFSNDKIWGSAIWQGEANAIIENYSEMFGEHLDPVVSLGNMSKLANTFGAKRLGAVLAKADAGALSGIMGQTHKLFNKMGVSDYAGEVAEEYYGQLWRTMLNLDDAYQLNPDGTRTNLLATGRFHGDIWGGMALSMGLMGAGRHAINAAQYVSLKHGVNKADANAREVFGAELWDPLRETIDLTTNENIGTVAESIANDKDMTETEREAALNYMERSLYMRGFNLGTIANSRGEKPSEEEQQANESYLDGYNATGSQEMNDAKNMLDYQRQRMIKVVGANDESLADGVIDWLNEAKNAPAGSERRQTILDYLNAKQVYDGMIQRVRDDIDGRIEQSDAMIDSRTNRVTGIIQGATMKQDDRKIYVVYGNIMPYADGTGVDIHASDGSIIVRDAETGTLEQVSPDAVLSVEEAQDPSEQKRLAADAIRLQLAQEAAGKIDGIVSFNPGDTYTLEGEDGEQMQIQVTANGEGIVDNGDGTVNVTDGTSIFQVAKDVIQQAADAANLARVEEFEKQRAAEEMARKQAAEEAAKPQYAMNDLITLRDGNGNSVRGSITADADADGRYEVYTEDAVNGKRVNLFTRDELDNMIVEHNGQAIENVRAMESDGNGGTSPLPHLSMENGTEPEAIGRNRWGNVYQWAVDKAKEAADFLRKKQTGYLKGVFHRDDIGDIDLVWGNDKGGLKHIIQKHIVEHDDFDSVEEAMSVMDDVVRNGSVTTQKDGIKIEANGYRVALRQSEDGNWIVTAYDITRTSDEKNRNTSGTRFDQAGLEEENGTLVSPSVSVDKDSARLADMQVPGAENALERIPKDEQGNPVYEQAETPDLAWDAIVEQAGGNEEMAQTVADGMVADKETALKKIEKAKPKGGRTVEEKIAAEKERKAAVDAAKQELAIWQKIAQTTKRRKIAAESERRRIATEQAALRRAEEEKLRAEREEAERKEREALNGVPDMVDDTPQDARARGYRRVNGHKYDRQAPVPGLQGKKVSVKFGDGIIPTGNIAVIESRRLQPSHIAGQRNPLHFIDEAQPKERNDEASVLSAGKIAGNIRPEEITSSVTAFTGAPTVNARGEAIQGNNRSDALRRMWESHPDQAAKYKQYLKDHADEFGLDADEIEAMERPVLVNMLDVEDADAITLGQYVAQDTESGGTERIKPKNAVQKMGADMRTFANLLLSSSDEETSFAGLVDNNGGEVLAWMNRKGYITPTQYKSAFDSKGNLTAEAKNDLKGIMYQSIFQNGNTRLEEMFNAMPAKAQRAILATAYRDYDSPNAERMVEEIQNSIRAYNALSQDEAFVSAKNWKEARMAVDAWKRQYAMDDVTGESYLPADKFSNFALHLATMYKGESQSLIQGTFNQLYDLIQGTQEETLFEKPDNTPRTLIQAIKETLNIDYNGQQRSNVLAGDSAAGQEREQGSAGASATGEQVEGGEQSIDDTSGIGEDSRGRGDEGNLAGREQDNSQEVDENGHPFVVSANGTTTFGEIRDESGLPAAPIKLSQGVQGKDGKGYGLVHIEANHGEQIRNVGFNSVEEFVSYVAENYDEENIRVGKRRYNGSSTFLIQVVDSHDNTLFIELSRDGSYWNVNSAGIFRKGYSNKKETVAKTEPQQPNNAVSSGSSLSKEELSGITSSEPNGKPTVSVSKGNEKTTFANDLGNKIAVEEGKVNTNPTDAQKAAGNYKKGHVQVGSFDVTIENPKGSVRSGVDAQGNPWQNEMHNTYGYIRGTEGVDGDHIDVFLSDDIDGWDGHRVFVIDQYNSDGTFDEHKVMLGFNDEEEAEAAYLSNYDDEWAAGRRIDGSSVLLDDFEKWINSSHRKTKPFAEYRSVKNVETSTINSDAGTGYTVEPAQYTTKRGKVLDMHLVKFSRELAKDELRSAKELAKGLKGWYDSKQTGFMMRSEEDAQQLVDAVMDESGETLSDAAPISLQDVRKVNEEITPAETEAKKNEGAFGLVSDDRMAELKERLRKKLGGQLNMGIDPEILAIGMELAVGHIDRGIKTFTDFSKKMIADLGDVIRPYLKAFYNGARDLPEVIENGLSDEMTPYDEVSRFDVANFDKESTDPFATADMVVSEQEKMRQADEAKKDIANKRNTERRKNNEKAKADTETIVSEAEAVAGEAESDVENATDEKQLNEIANTIDKQIEKESSTPLKVGDKVMYKGEEATIYDIENGRPVLDTGLAPVMYEVAEWVDLSPVTQASENKQLRKSTKKKNSVSSHTELADLFNGLFNDKTLNSKNNKNGLQRNDAVRSEGLSADGGKHTERLSEGSEKDSGSEAQGGSGLDAGRKGTGVRSDRSVRPRLSDSIEELAPSEQKNTHNNHSERGANHAPTSVDARIEANIKAIELAQQLIDSGEQATEKQMQVLRKFSGWGGLGKAFSDSLYSAQLQNILGAEAYQDAVMSANSAYYTPAYVVDTLWDIAEQMGFKGGNILEGSAGIGNILGQMPTSISERSDIYAIEIDGTSGNILSLLYPDAKVEIQGFEHTHIPNGSVDLAITNVPFVTGLRVNDTTGDKDLSKKFHNIHDFCIAKNVRKLREGGLGIFITSNGTLDNSKQLRDWIVSEGGSDFIGAFRMNNKTFGGTGVTSDIIVIRKRVNGRKSANAIDVSTITGERSVDYDTGDTRKVKGQTVPVIKHLAMDYNRYFVEHPENMAGVMKFAFEQGDTFRPTAKGLYPEKGKNQEKMLADFVSSFKEEIDTPSVSDESNKTGKEYVSDASADGKKLGELYVKDGKLVVAGIGGYSPLEVNANKAKGHTKVECFQAYAAIKDALAEVLKYQTENESDSGLKPLLAKLNKAYDDFVSTYGHFNKNTAIAFLRNDVDFANVFSLEKYEETGDKSGKRVQKFGKADVFSQRVVEKEKEPNPTNVKDGIIASVFKFGRIDVPYIANQLGRSVEDVKKEIISSGYGFEDPATKQMELSYQYLSGNVREKLRQAEANNENGEYDGNIKALQKVIPMDIPAHLIDFTLGSSWITPKLYEEYIKDRTDIDVKLTAAGGSWFMDTPYYVNNEKNRSMGVYSEMLHTNIFGHTLIEAAIQNKTITVSRTSKKWDGSTETITDKEATQACAAKIDEIRQDFKDWARQKMQSDSEMSDEMERIYNDTFNNYVPMSIPDEFVPEYFGGASHKFKMRPHQGRAIVRGTMQPLLLAHEVGTGKTFTLISTAMEMRRLGTARKPMIVVQNATVGQFVASAKELYPNAKILTLEEADRTADGRKNFYAKIRHNDWDMIVVPQSTFEFIPDSEERQMQFVQDKIEEKKAVLENMQDADPRGESMITRQAKKEISDLEAQLAELSESASKKRSASAEKKRAVTLQNAEVKALEMLDRRTDDVENFDDMGIDALLIDEAHEYKHLGFATAMQRGVKGVDSSYSKKSQGVYLKTQAVLENNNGRNVIFATGTPISNTAAEIWTFMRYLMPADTMKEYGIYYFDDFVRNFGNIQQMLEFNTNGKFKESNRFAGYVNLPELVRIWSGISDTVLTKEAEGVNDKIPDIEGGKAQDLYLPQTKALRSIMKFVKSELQRYEQMSGREKKENSHIPLTMYGIAKSAAVDARLVSDAEDDPNSKTNEAVRQTLRSLKETASYKGTVAIFSDNYQNKETSFNLYDDIRNKLIAEGVPADEVVVIRPGMTVKKKLEIFEKVNRGEIRVVLGSTYTLGTGVNIQERLHTLIHLDAPNRPMDYTQRNGRILRQGNLHKVMGKPVRILRFGVEDSLDVTAYQRLKTKGAIADSIMNGKQMMANNMTNRVLEEEEDVFGDTVAQLSGSEYAMLKNNAEKNVRKFESRKKQWEADQTYIHNAKPKIKGQIAEAEKRAKTNRMFLQAVEQAFPGGKFESITAGKHTFSTVEDMADFFKEHNKVILDKMKQMKEGGDDSHTRELTVTIGDYSFKVRTVLSKDIGRNGGQLFSEVHRQMTYSCPELGLEDVSVYQNLLRNAIDDIVQNVITGKNYAERVEKAENDVKHYQSELKQVESREGVPFEYASELEQAKKQYEEYSELMKKEMEEKEAKYAEMDKDVEAASDISTSEDDDDDLMRDSDTMYRIRESAAPKKTGIGYKVFVLKNGELYPPMVANPNGAATPVGVWIDADAAPIAGQSKTGRNQVKAGGKGTQGGSGKLAYRPGWHLGEIPYALQFNRINPETGEKELFPANFVWAEVEYANDKDYQEEAMSYGMNANGKFQHSLAGLPRIPENGSYRYRTNPNPETDPWIITGAMKVNRLLTPSEVDAIVEDAGREPQQRQEGAVTDEQINALNAEIERTNNVSPRKLRKQMAERAKELASALHLDNVEVVTSTDGLKPKQKKAKGFYTKSTGKITIVVPNNTSIADVEQTLLHEAVAHYGLRKLFGSHFDTFLDNVFNNAEDSIRRKIVDLSAKNGWDFRKATEEYLAGLAERTNFEEAQKTGWWARIKQFFSDMLDKLGFSDFRGVTLSDNELRYVLWRSYENLKDGNGIFGEAADVAMQYELGVGEYANTSTDDVLNRDGDPEMHERTLARHKYEMRVRNGMYQSREALQDSMLGLKEAMTAILGDDIRIEDVAGFENAYLGENRLSSVNKAEADAFAHLLFKPMLDEVAALAPTEADREELTDYMMAKHGLERNRVMRANDVDNDKADETDYAGLTALTGLDDVANAEAEAQAMVDEYEDNHDTEELWKKVNAVSDAILSKSYECGMMSKETFDKISDMYEFYIPLRGFDEKTSAEAYAYLTHSQSAFNAPIKKAEGRHSKADDPFANLQSMAESAITQGNRNKLVKQKFLNFALNHPSDLVSVSDLWLQYNAVTKEWTPVFPDNIDINDSPDEVERKMNDFEEKMKQLAAADPKSFKRGRDAANIPYRVVESRDLRQHQVIVKRNGRDYVITINGNPRAAQALNGQTNPDNDTSGAIGALLRAGEKINRQLSAFYTTRNPDFIVSNFVRDMLYTNSMVWIKESPNYALRFHRNVARVNPVVLKSLLAKHRKGTLDKSNHLENMFDQFMMNGGETGYANIRDIEQHKNDIKRELKKANGKLKVSRAWQLLGERFDELNRAVENCARFAAFITSREMGRTIDRAIYDAKEISVNFNKKGSGAKFYDTAGQSTAGNASAIVSGLGRSGYVFWNAAIQGATNFGRQFKRHPAKALIGAAAMFILGAVIAYLGGIGDDGDDDDKNAYYNLPEYVRRSNILFRAGNHWISLPLPVEYRALYGMGELMTSVISGKEHLTGGEIASAIAGQATQMLPIDFLEGGGGLNAFVPSAAKPLWEAYVAEKSWTGMPLYKDTPYNKDMPEWTKAYKSANKHIVNLAATLNEMTGGDPYTKGAIDINPAKVEYLLNGYFGGVFGTIDKLAKTGETILGDREYDPRNILLVNRLVKAGDERTEYRAVNNEYFRLKEEHDRVKSRLKHYENDTDKGVFDYAEKIDFLYNSPEYERYEIFEDYRRDIDGLYDELKDVADDDERKQVEAELNALKKEMIEEMEKTRKRK